MPLRRRDFLAASAAPLLPAQQTRKPNIVIIVADDLGYADLGFQGSREILTPWIDSIARTGVRCTNGYVTHPFCSPTRAALLTGRYQQRFGHENNMVFNQKDEVAGLPLTETTLAQTLASNGYRTGIVGKWHLGAHPRFHPMKRGFQEMFGFVGGGHDYFDPGTPGETHEHLIPVERDGKPAPMTDYLTTALGKEAALFVDRNAAKPFFLYFTPNAPHGPLQAPPSQIQRYDVVKDTNRRTYCAMVALLDDAVGRLLFALRVNKVLENTLIFLISDNGGPIPGNSSSNAPLRGAKRTLYEGGIRVPFAIHWPGKVPADKEYSEPVSSLDIFPTALAAAGIAPSPARHLDGVNLVPYLNGQNKGRPHEYLFWRTFGGVNFAARDARYKLVKNQGAEAELYDLNEDIAETKNLVREKPEIAKKLSAALESWNKTLVKPKWDDHIFHRKKDAGSAAK